MQHLMERPTSPDEQEGEQASAEEQAAYEYYATQALDFIHNDKTANFVKNTIGKAQDPLDGIAKATAVIMMRLEVQNKDKGGMPDEVKLEVAQDIVEELINLVIQSGVIDGNTFEQNADQYVEQIIKQAYQEYMQLKEQSGQLDPQQEQQNLAETVNATQQMAGINALGNEAAGQLQKMFGGQNG